MRHIKQELKQGYGIFVVAWIFFYILYKYCFNEQ